MTLPELRVLDLHKYEGRTFPLSRVWRRDT